MKCAIDRAGALLACAGQRSSTAVLPKGLMNSRRLMGFISLAENHLRKSLIRFSSESYAPHREQKSRTDVRFVPKADGD